MKRLVIRPGAIGDAIVSLPAVASLEPAEIWCPEQNIPLFAHIAPARSLVAAGLDALVLAPSTLQALGAFDEIVSWYAAARDDFRDQVRHLPFRFLAALPPEQTKLHATDFYLRQTGAPGGATPQLPVARQPGGFAVIHPFSGSAAKNWPLASFREAAALLAPHCPVEWCAGPAEPLPEARRFPSLGELIPWLATASVYIGNDAGITHLAAACGVPTVALFGPTDPRIWAPRGCTMILKFEATAEAVTEAARSLRR